MVTDNGADMKTNNHWNIDVELSIRLVYKIICHLAATGDFGAIFFMLVTIQAGLWRQHMSQRIEFIIDQRELFLAKLRRCYVLGYCS